VSAQPGRTRGLRAAFAAAGAAIVLTGCAAGQVASTSEIVPVVDGISAQAGAIGLRAVAVSPPTDRNWAEGSSAPLQMYLVNNGSAPDQLVSVTTDRAASVQLVAHGGVAASTASSSSASSSPASSATSPSPSASATSSTSTSRGSSQPISLPAGQSISVGFDPGNPQVLLTGLKETLFPATSFAVTFQFAQAGSVTAQVPVHLAPGPSSTPTINVSPSEGE
jgi:copper(I)-binding protein